MEYTNSPLVVYTKLSPNQSGTRTHAIDRITPHCVVGQCTAESLGALFADPARQASSNYGIDKDGRVGMYCPESNRSWCSSNRDNDQRGITIECASSTKHPYEMYDTVYATLIELCTDICRRNGKKKLLWFADKEKTLAYKPAADEMLITVHRWFENKSCPGDWLYSRLGDVATKVTVALGTDLEMETTPEVKPTPFPMPEKEYPEKLTEGLYRVRRNWSDGNRGQIGAYRFLSNAKRRADNNPGYSVFTDDGVAIYPKAEKAPTTKEEETERVHTVVRGDTLYEIAKAYLADGSRYMEIKTLNGLTSNTIYVGMKLKIPN